MKRMLLTYFLLLASTFAHATEQWIADSNTGCQIRNPRPLPGESVSWEGACKDGKADGPGTLRWHAKGKLFLTLEGVMEEGQCQRNCTVTTAAGYKYVGELQENRPNGSGTMNYPDGSRYSGDWANGKKHGKGTFTAKDGSSHAEKWEHGRKVFP